MNPFNLVLATDTEAMLVTNRPDLSYRALSPGIHGISNGAEPGEWETTGRLKQRIGHLLEDALVTTEKLLPQLMGALDDRESDGHTERADDRPSKLFVQHPVYGTRCSTIVAIDGQGRGLIWERRFDAHGARTGEAERAFTWPA